MQKWTVSFGLGFLLALKSYAITGSAKQVISYQPGSGVTLTQTGSALGLPDALVGEGTPFVSILSPFNPPYEAAQLLQIGPGGEITLQLSHFAIVGPGAELGVFSNVGILDVAYPLGKAGSPITLFGTDSVVIEVSEDGQTYFSLGEKNISLFHNIFTDVANPYSVTPGSQRADFGKAFIRRANDFSGKNYEEIKQILAGSAGGNWFDVGTLPVTKIGYVRFSLPASASQKFELDAVTVNKNLLGTAMGSLPSHSNVKRMKVAVLKPSRNERVPAQFMAIGTLKAKNRIVGVEFNINHGPWMEATLMDKNWSALIDVPSDLEAIQLEVRCFDEEGQRSKSKFRIFKIVR